MVVKITLKLKDNQKYFKHGDKVEGDFTIDNTGSKIDLKDITVYFTGKTKRSWVEDKPPEPLAEDQTWTKVPHDAKTNILYKSEVLKTGGDLDRGCRSYHFDMGPITDEAPPSFEGPNGYCRYQIKLKVDREDGGDDKFKELISVVPDREVPGNNLQPHTVQDEKTVCCLCCKKGPICVSVTTNKTGFVPGEYVKVSGSVDNRQFNKEVKTNALLKQQIIYYDGNNQKVVDRDVVSLAIPTVGANEQATFENLSVRIPSTAPSGSYNGLSVNYRLEVKLNAGTIPLVIDIHLYIGTKPAAGQEVPAISYIHDMFTEHLPPKMEKGDNYSGNFRSFTPSYRVYAYETPTDAKVQIIEAESSSSSDEESKKPGNSSAGKTPAEKVVKPGDSKKSVGKTGDSDSKKSGSKQLL